MEIKFSNDKLRKIVIGCIVAPLFILPVVLGELGDATLGPRDFWIIICFLSFISPLLWVSVFTLRKWGKTYIYFDETGLKFRHTKGSMRELKWGDIDRCVYNKKNGGIKVYMKEEVKSYYFSKDENTFLHKVFGNSDDLYFNINGNLTDYNGVEISNHLTTYGVQVDEIDSFDLFSKSIGWYASILIVIYVLYVIAIPDIAFGPAITSDGASIEDWFRILYEWGHLGIVLVSLFAVASGRRWGLYVYTGVEVVYFTWLSYLIKDPTLLLVLVIPLILWGLALRKWNVMK